MTSTNLERCTYKCDSCGHEEEGECNATPPAFAPYVAPKDGKEVLTGPTPTLHYCRKCIHAWQAINSTMGIGYRMARNPL